MTTKDCVPFYSKTVVCETPIEAMFCCDQKQFHRLKAGEYYKHNTPLTKKIATEIVDGEECEVALFQKWTFGDTLDGIITCAIDATCWDGMNLKQWMCTRVNDPFPGTLLCWPAGTKNKHVEAVLATVGCCFNISPSHKLCLEDCDTKEAVDGEKSEKTLSMPSTN